MCKTQPAGARNCWVPSRHLESCLLLAGDQLWTLPCPSVITVKTAAAQLSSWVLLHILCVFLSIYCYQKGDAETWNDILFEKSKDGNSYKGEAQPLLSQQETSTSKTRFKATILASALFTGVWLATTRWANHTCFRMFLSFFFFFLSSISWSLCCCWIPFVFKESHFLSIEAKLKKRGEKMRGQLGR